MESNRYCEKCGGPLHADSSFCPRCGAAVSPAATSHPASAPPTWREQRRQERAERRGRRGGFGGLIVATVLIVAGLGIFFPSLPWEIFWGGLLILLGVWIAFAWTVRNRRYNASLASSG